MGLCGRSHVEDIKFDGLVRVESMGMPGNGLQCRRLDRGWTPFLDGT